ncbi:hypothetical protein HYX12_02395 [Candidatus Woesearchaeota archaeon]|nr:hypothetical protein [Candidatus Woesearchaeota archaeon]
MGYLWSGKEVIARVYKQLSASYNPTRLALPEKMVVVAGKENGFRETPIFLAYQEFGVFQLPEHPLRKDTPSPGTYWVIGKGEQASSKKDQGYAADLLAIRLKSLDLAPEDLMRALPRCANLSQSLLQASTSGALLFDSRLSQLVVSRAKEILINYVVHPSGHQHDSSKPETLEFMYRPERTMIGSIVVSEEMEEDNGLEIDDALHKDPSHATSRSISLPGIEEKRRIDEELSTIIIDCLRSMKA